jgi:hypothetical protein
MWFPNILHLTSSFLNTLFALVSDTDILMLESNEGEAPAPRAHWGILYVVSWRSRTTIDDVVGAALVVIALVSKY